MFVRSSMEHGENKMKKTTTILLSLSVFAVCLVSAAPAALIEIDVVDARACQKGDGTVGYGNNNGNVSRIFEGNGLTKPDAEDPTTWTHDDNWTTGWQAQGPSNLTSNRGWVIADFGAAQTNLDKIYIWNENEKGNRGMATINIYYATSVTLPPTSSDSANPTDYDFSDAAWTLFNPTAAIAVPPGTSNPGSPLNATIDISAIPIARYIAIEAVTDNGAANDRVGLAEVVFTGVPEPATMTMLALSGLAIIRKRRR